MLWVLKRWDDTLEQQKQMLKLMDNKIILQSRILFLSGPVNQERIKKYLFRFCFKEFPVPLSLNLLLFSI